MHLDANEALLLAKPGVPILVAPGHSRDLESQVHGLRTGNGLAARGTSSAS